MSFFDRATRDEPDAFGLTGPKFVHLEKRYNRTVNPVLEPVTLADAKEYMGVEHDLDDAQINDFIEAARQLAEDFTSSAFITQTWEMSMDRAPRERRFDIGFPPLQSVSKIETFDDANVATTMSNTLYIVDLTRGIMPSRVALNQGQVWPSDLRTTASFLTTYIAGYGLNPSDVPAQIKTAIKSQVKIWYDEGEECKECKDCLCQSVKARLNNYRVFRGVF